MASRIWQNGGKSVIEEDIQVAQMELVLVNENHGFWIFQKILKFHLSDLENEKSTTKKFKKNSSYIILEVVFD